MFNEIFVISGFYLRNNRPALLESRSKAELLQEGIFFLIHLFAQAVLVMKK